MNYLSAYLWEQAKEDSRNCVSLVLQHAKVYKRDVIFACVCESSHKGEDGVTESGYFSEGLTEWFHREGVKLCARKEMGEIPGESLYMEIERLEKETADYLQRNGKAPGLQYWGLFLWESKAWFFAKGECKGFLLNRRFQKKNVRELLREKEGQKICRVTGSVQRRLGILICTGGFTEGMDIKTLGEVLMPEGELSEERMEKRMRELWQAGGCSAVGAVYLHT